MLNDEEFFLYYNSEIKPIVDKFEQYRKEKLFEYRSRKAAYYVSILIFLIITFYFYPHFLKEISYNLMGLRRGSVDNYEFILPVIIISIIGMIFSYFKMKNARKEFDYNTKTQLYRQIIGFYPQLEYRPFSGVNSSTIAESNLFPSYDAFKSENYIQGQYKSIKIILSQIELIKITQMDVTVNGYTKTINKEQPIFKGLFFITSLNKKFSSTTYVIKDQLIKIFNDLPRRLKRVTLEDTAFESEFDVYSDNQIEARYLLTPSFMEGLIKLNQKAALRCCFVDNKLFLGLATKDDFMPSLALNEKVDYQRIKQVIQQIDILFEMVDTLKLDINIGL